MFTFLGIIFALSALLCWGFGDFLIQKSARKIGDWESIFIISLSGSIILLPFIFSDINYLLQLNTGEILALILVGISFFLSAIINIEALKKGKLSVIEAVGAIEIPVAGILAFLFLGQYLIPYHWIFVIVLLIGIFLVSLKPHHFKRETWIEKGALLALFGGLIMGTTDFMVGYSSKITNPVITVWFFNILMLAISLTYLSTSGRIKHFWKDLKVNKKLMLSIGILDNVAWLSFALATNYLPIVIALVLSESYIILATLLGVTVNKEKLTNYQIVGIILSLFGVIVLSYIYA